jgi:hypothetical protein
MRVSAKARSRVGICRSDAYAVRNGGMMKVVVRGERVCWVSVALSPSLKRKRASCEQVEVLQVQVRGRKRWRPAFSVPARVKQCQGRDFAEKQLAH